MSKRIIDLPSGSVSDNELTFVGDPSVGALTNVSYLDVKNYVLSGSFLAQTGSYVTTASFNAFSQSYSGASASFNNEIQNLIVSESGLIPTSSFNILSSSYHVDSGSFYGAIQNLSGSMLTGSYVTTTTFGVFSSSYNMASASFYTRETNIYASQSNYLSTSSFASYSSSYVNDSSSFNNRITNTYASESGYLLTGSFNTFSSSYVNASASFNMEITNTFLSESAYLLTSSINGKSGYFVIFTGSQAFVFSNVFQSGSSVLINQVVGTNNAILQVAGPLSVNDTSYIQLPVGSTLQRLTGSAASFGMFRANSDSSSLEYNNGTGWVTLGVSSGSSFPTGSVTSVGLSLPNSLFTVYNSPVIGAATLSASLNTQSINLFFASPTSSNGVPGWRTLALSDISAFTASFIQGFVLTSSFNAFSSSYATASASFQAEIVNVYASESNYTLTSSFNTLSSSYHTDSSSFLSTIANVYASESNYTLTSSFNTFSSSYVNASASIATTIANVYASESGYHLTSSITGSAGYITLFTSPLGLSTSSIYQSGSYITIGGSTIAPGGSTMIMGGAYISGGLYDYTISTGSQGFVLASTPSGLLWVSTGSGGWLLSGNSISSGSFLGSTNTQDVIIKRNSIQMALFTSNNNVVLGNANNGITGSNAIVLGGTNNFANNMSAVIVGSNNTGSGNSSVVVGGSNGVSQGIGSVVLGGTNLSASAAYAIVMGRFNNPISSSTPGSWVGGDPLLIVGNGSSTSSLSNALVLFKTGSLSLPYYASAVSSVLSVDSNGNVNSVPVSGSSMFAMFDTTASLNALSSSYVNDSSSFNLRINNISSSIQSLTGSYVTTGSFNTYTASAVSQSLNIFSSQSNYLSTSSINGSSGYITMFSGSTSLSSSILYQVAAAGIGIGTTTPAWPLHVYGGIGASYLILTGSGTGLDGLKAAISTYSRPATASNSTYSAGIEEYSFIHGNAGFYAYSGIQSYAYLTGGNPGNSGGKFTNYLAAFNAGQVWDGSGATATASRLDNLIGYFSSLNSQTGSVLNAYDHYVSELNSISATTKQPVVTNHYGFYSERFTGASNNYGIFINGPQINYFGGEVLIGSSGSSNSSLLQIYGNAYVSGSIFDSTNSTGSVGQVLSSTATGILWINASASGVLSGSYVTTASITGINNYFAIFSGSSSLTSSNIYHSGSSLLVGGNTTGSNNSILQVFGNIYISKSIVDSTGNTGSAGQALVNTGTGIQWQTTGSSVNVLNFIIGDGQSFTPASGSTQLSSSIIAGRTILQFFQEGAMLAQVSRSISYISVTSSQGIINLNNATFDPDTFFSILYK